MSAPASQEASMLYMVQAILEQREAPIPARKKILYLCINLFGLTYLVFTIIFMVKYKQGSGNAYLDLLFNVFWIHALVMCSLIWCLQKLLDPYYPFLELRSRDPSPDLLCSTFLHLFFSFCFALISKLIWGYLLFRDDRRSSVTHDPLYLWYLATFFIETGFHVLWGCYTVNLYTYGYS